jgi:hypothetical protein
MDLKIPVNSRPFVNHPGCSEVRVQHYIILQRRGSISDLSGGGVEPVPWIAPFGAVLARPVVCAEKCPRFKTF